MASSNSTAGRSSDPSPVAKLLGFLKLHLDSDEMKDVEKKAHHYVLHPEDDTKDFVKEVNNAMSQKLNMDRSVLEDTMEMLIGNYKQQMRIDEGNEREVTSSQLSDHERIKAAKELIKGLDVIIPEARRSNMVMRAVQVTIEDFEDFIAELEEDICHFEDEREDDIQSRLRVALNNFENDLLTIFKQRRMASKINLIVETLEEKIPEEIRTTIIRAAESIKSELESTNLYTPNLVKDIFKLVDNVKKLSAKSSTKHFKKAAKKLEEAAIYLCGEDENGSSR